jgi:hypothetical protein
MKKIGNIYKIFKSEYFNEYGVCQSSHYYIKYLKKFLWWTYWKEVKHEECGWGDCSATRTTFKTEQEAEDFINKVLCPNKVRDGHQQTEVKTIECK